MDSIKVINCIEKTGIKLDSEKAGRFVRYYELLIEWNSFMNLTAITDEDEVLIKHFADSLSLFSPLIKESPLAASRKGLKLMDVGTGAGFPSIPLKIAYPELEITMLDSLGKRVKFLNEVISQLKLEKINALHSRAEDAAHDKAHREHYDIVVSRAVANMRVLSEYCLPFVKQGGYFAAYKAAEYLNGDEGESSLKAVKTLGGDGPVCKSIELPGEDMQRCLVFIKKIKPTPGKYPRKAGTPSKEPL